MADAFKTFGPTPLAPARKAVVITPNDAADLADVPKALYANSAGDVRVTMVDGGTVTYTVAGPGPLDIVPSRVWATGTTVSSLIGLIH